jgi:hypothetical protein
MFMGLILLKVLQLNNVKEGFIVKGRAPNANDVVGKARVVLAPLRFGAGIKENYLKQCYAVQVLLHLLELNPCVVIYHGMDL